MPFHKRSAFVPNPVPLKLRPDEPVFYLRVTNEVFKDYDEYFERVILCNSLVWACSVTGKINLTFEEALESEREAKKTLLSIATDLKKALLFLVNETQRGKVLEACEDVFSYAREHYFVGETVLGVIGNLWCHSRVLKVIEPTALEIQNYREEKEAKGELQSNDYLRDDTWGPPPDLFRYEVEELDPDDPELQEVHILEAIDVKREKLSLTKEKCRYLLKATTVYDEKARVWRVKEEVMVSLGMKNVQFEGDVFVGKTPQFEYTPGPPKRAKSTKSSPNSLPENKEKTTEKKKKKRTSKQEKKKVETLSPEEEKAIELERKTKEREAQKEEKKMIVEFKKLWMKPKEDLEVEDLQDLPVGDPVQCRIPSELFGDFVMVLEYLSSYATFLRLKDTFPQGVSFDTLERALLKEEIAGPLSELLQLLLRAIFRLQEAEEGELAQEQLPPPQLFVTMGDEGQSSDSAMEEATTAATWSMVYQNTPLYRLPLDHLSLSEILRLHFLASGARPTEREVKNRQASRGGISPVEDPGLEFRLVETDVLETLSEGTIFNLDLRQKLKVLVCLINQILTFSEIRETVDKAFDQTKEARVELRVLQAAERKSELEDQAWRTKLKTERVVPDEKPAKNGNPSPVPITKPQRVLTEEEIEGFLKKRLRDAARRKDVFEAKMAELLEDLQKKERRLGVHPLGKDRAHRRYWAFAPIPGLFVEEDKDNTTCLSTPTPRIPEPDLQDINFIREHFPRYQSLESGFSVPKASTAKAFAEVYSEGCSGGVGVCPIHSPSQPRPQWSFFSTEEELDKLIQSLSPRGVREKDLRQVLMEEGASLRQKLKNCPRQKLNVERDYGEVEKSRRMTAPKTNFDPNLNYPAKTPVPTILELQLRDLILEAEEKIFLGTLGALKVKDRGSWIRAIESRGYQAEAAVLRWGEGKAYSNDPSQGGSVMRRSEETLVRDLALAILQLEQSLEIKFFRAPLGEEEAEKSRKKLACGLRGSWVSGSALERWESSLMHSITLSQLFLHFFTLDKSISWNRSVLNARCRICRRKGDSENMLLCDGCNKGHHSYCFKPPLLAVPKGEWFCVDCAPPQLPLRLPRRKVEVEQSEEEDSDVAMPVLEEESLEFCIVCGRGGEVICCDGCPALFHLHCLNPPKQRVPRGSWFCDSCKEAGERKERRSKKHRFTSSESSEETSLASEPRRRHLSDSESEEEEVSTPVKVRIRKSIRKKPPSPPESLSDSDEKMVVVLGRGTKRRCASRAVLRISQAAKRLRSDSKENESSESSSESIEESRNNLDSDETQPKRTRLQRMNTNLCGDSGDLDDVILDKLVVDLMRHPAAWPFLKPVTRSEAPDYHDMIRTPMDLGTIKYKLNSMVYTCNQEFLGDLHLVFENCFSYNAPSAPVFKAGEDLRLFCRRRCEKAGIHFGETSLLP